MKPIAKKGTQPNGTTVVVDSRLLLRNLGHDDHYSSSSILILVEIFYFPDFPRVSRVVGGWAKMAKKCLTPSKIQNSKKWSKVCSRVLWNRVTMAGS